MFREIGLPPISAEFREDRVFAAMRVAGPNPVVLEQVKALDGRLPIDSAMFQLAVAHNLPGSTDTLEAALREGRLYLADYALLDGAELGTLPNGQKYLYAPLALFVVTGPAKELLPVAIQCRQEPAPDNPVFTPNDGYNWLIAKTIVETADGNLHEASTHLGRTHLAMEAFLLASYRQLSWRHPLRVLLGPHFEGTLAINEMAWKFLVSEGGAVDYLMAGTIQTSRKVAAAGLQSLNIMDDRLPLTFSKRGVADSTLFPNYPYRDDSLLYWNAIHQWVSDYVQLYYLSDTDVAEDDELKAWGREIVAPDGGRLRGIPNGGSIQTVGELIDVLTFVIYTCSVQHAAVNFPQYDCMSYVPNMPLAGYRPAPTSKTGATEADFVAMLPTLDMAELQMEVTYLLGSVHYTQLGQYGDNHFEDARVAEPLRSFQQRLKQIDATIKDRNSSRRPYATLAASGIPQSINI
jgi:arachidonate 15-lipoxygenase